MTDSPLSQSSPSSKKHLLPIKNADTPKSISSAFTTRKAFTFAYCFTLLFVGCAFFLVFKPTSSGYSLYSSPWLNNFLTITTDATYSYRSQFSSLFSHFHSNSSSFSRSPNPQFRASDKRSPNNNNTSSEDGVFSLPQFSYQTSQSNPTVADPGKHKELEGRSNSPLSSDGNGTDGKKQNVLGRKNETGKGASGKVRGTINVTYTSERREMIGKDKKWMKKMKNCDIFDGRWVRDDSYPLFAPGMCREIDEPFDCFLNGRPDRGYEKYRWQPKHCNIPRLNGRDMLEMLRGKRLVYVGDSLNRNMWESLLCILRNAVGNKSRVFEVSGKEEFRTEGFYSFLFEEYNCSVEFFRSPFLVQEWEMPDTNGSKKETLRLDLVERSCDKYKSADVLIFNTGHWWTHEKTLNGKGYYQEGSHIYDQLHVNDAFQKALTTWAKWVEANVDPFKTHVFFRGYSVSHFRGGEWNSGGKCDNETEPLREETYFEEDPPMVKILESVLRGMTTPVYYLNITRMTNFRKDAHPSVYREQNLTEEEKNLRVQDCSHWCLPGVPDTWNEIVYSQILFKHKQRQLKHYHHQIQRKIAKKP